MMKHLKLNLFFLLVNLTYSCQRAKPDIKGIADNFADMECRAISLREKRFELANQIRFTQDSVLHNSDSVKLKIKLAVFDQEKEGLLKQSQSLADSIRLKLNDLMKNQLKNEHDKAAFNQMLNEILLKRGCLKS